jgi:flagellar biosynthesis chaperone FliJ
MADCYFLAALAGLAEDEEEKAHLQLGTRIRNNFLTDEYNEAGCYAVEFYVDG